MNGAVSCTYIIRQVRVFYRKFSVWWSLPHLSPCGWLALLRDMSRRVPSGMCGSAHVRRASGGLAVQPLQSPQGQYLVSCPHHTTVLFSLISKTNRIIVWRHSTFVFLYISGQNKAFNRKVSFQMFYFSGIII